jgi:hypothetical protein
MPGKVSIPQPLVQFPESILKEFLEMVKFRRDRHPDHYWMGLGQPDL